jgi:aminoglycoside 6'-N-acetyltransferase
MDDKSPAQPQPLTPLQSERLLLRPATAEDAPELAAILAEPEVARWWGDTSIDSIREELATQPAFVIVIDGETAGWLQINEESDPEYPSVAFDIALTTKRQGSGYGPEALRTAIAHFIDRGHHRFTIDPATGNERAIRSYEGVGFRPVGVMRDYQRLADGSYRDGLLMDLLAGEFS